MTKLLGETVELRCTVLGYRQRALNSCQTHENQLICRSELSCFCLVFFMNSQDNLFRYSTQAWTTQRLLDQDHASLSHTHGPDFWNNSKSLIARKNDFAFSLFHLPFISICLESLDRTDFYSISHFIFAFF